MRLVIDLQPLQSDSQHRGIGRYVMALVRAILRQGNEHEIFLILNRALPDSLERIQKEFKDLVPKNRIISFSALPKTWETRPDDCWRLYVSEKIREYFIEQLQPDIILITSLFEGVADDSVVSIKSCYQQSKTAVIIYDFIPYLFPESYLPTTDSKARYLRKFNSLPKADLFLAISEHTRKDVISNLLVSPQQVFNISAAVDINFCSAALSTEDKAALLLEYGIIKPFVLYVPGGPDVRKNFNRLLEGYASLSTQLRQNHQLVIVSKMTPIDTANLVKQATQVYGLRPNELILTGYVSDEALISLYALCKVFVFPSLYEGFGLPVLEAMTCGAAVIGSDSSSIPEVIGLSDALFNPESSVEISRLLTRALEDDSFLTFLKVHSHNQIQKFSWDKSARLALETLEKLFREKTLYQRQNFKDSCKYRLAWVLPNTISQFRDVCPESRIIECLQNFYEVTLICDFAYDLDLSYEIKSFDWFIKNISVFDRIVYLIGNAPEFQDVVELLEAAPGIVILKDFFLGKLFYELSLKRNDLSSFYSQVYLSSGYVGLRDFQEKEMAEFFAKYPLNLNLFQNALGVISMASMQAFDLYKWFGEDLDRIHAVLPPLTANPQDSPLEDYLSNQDDIEDLSAGDRDKALGQNYFTAIEKFYRYSPSILYSQLLECLKTIDTQPFEPTKEDLKQAAIAIAENTLSLRRPQIFVDISELVHRDAKSGIQRVVRSILMQLLTQPPEGYRVEPVYFSGSQYYYARNFTHQFLSVNTALSDSPIDMKSGDIFLGLDLIAHLIDDACPSLQKMRHLGVFVYFVVYDILPIQHPEWWPQGVSQKFQGWAKKLVEYADGLACISEAVVSDLHHWFSQTLATSAQPVPSIPIQAFHLGGDLESSVPSQGLPEGADIFLQSIEKSNTFLMVGTIEPRKGHPLVLSAFEHLWKQNHDFSLIIVGKAGWLMDEFVDELTQHPQFNTHLFWLQGISDEYLDKIYAKSTALIAASEGEGFGLPLIEAAKHHLPIIARDIPVFREVAGEHAYYFQGHSSEELAESIQMWLSLKKSGNIPDSTQISWITWAESCQQLMDIVLKN